MGQCLPLHGQALRSTRPWWTGAHNVAGSPGDATTRKCRLWSGRTTAGRAANADPARCAPAAGRAGSASEALERYLGAPPGAASYRAHRPQEYAGSWAARPGINYYGAFYRSELGFLALRIDEHLVRWAMHKFKRLRRRPDRAWAWLRDARKREPKLFAHWHLLARTGGRSVGAG